MSASRQAPVELFWFLGANAAAMMAFAVAPQAGRLPAGIASIAAFVACGLIWPSCRPDLKSIISPRNIALFLFWLQLVLLPLLIGYYGFSRGMLPYLPSDGAINQALLLQAGAFAGFSWAFHHSVNRRRAPRRAQPDILAQRSGRSTIWLLIALYMVCGVIGVVLVFPTWGSYVEFLTDPQIQRIQQFEAGSFPRALNTFLRPFLSVGVVLAWSYWVSRGAATRRPKLLMVSAIILAVCLPLLNFNYNRGSMFGPILALGAAFSCHVRRLSLPLIAGVGAALLFAALMFGSYRAGKATLGREQLTGGSLAASTDPTELMDFVQVYGNAPQFPAFLIEQVKTGRDLYWGQTLLSSTLYPLPILGKPFRPTSGVEIYNQLIYGTSGIVDQVILYEAEFYLNFSWIGVLVGYAFLGWVFSWFQHRFDQATSPVETFSWLLMGLWLIWPGSLPVTSQAFIYSFWPIYLYLGASWLFRLRAVPSRVALGGASSVSAVVGAVRQSTGEAARC